MSTELARITHGDILEISIFDEGDMIASEKISADQIAEISLKTQKLWSPESPFLYDMRVRLFSRGALVDEVKSYFAMRKIATKRDDHGILRMQLNNTDYFQYGTLEQGWWPDGLYTAPSDEALKYEPEFDLRFVYSLDAFLFNSKLNFRKTNGLI
ncbi:MAG: hypothetical protein QM485_13220 [Flavobacteriaceae bacterium]